MPEHRLGPLQLLPPPTRAASPGGRLRSAETTLRRTDAVEIPIPLPLFWYDPPWIRFQPTVADQLAASVARQDVVVSAIGRDLEVPEEAIRLMAPVHDDNETNSLVGKYLPRMTPYRIERYGLSVDDFDGPRVIDVRLTPFRDASGRLAYSQPQMNRWERPEKGVAISGGGYVAVASFPPDVVSLKQLAVKLDQLRSLAPHSAVFVSIGPFRLEEDVSSALVARPDGLIVRLDEVDLDGKQLARQVHRVRRLIDESDGDPVPLWIVPGPVSPDDVAKLVALGASAVAIDHWCVPLIERLENELAALPFDRHSVIDIESMAAESLWQPLDRVVGLLSSFPPDQNPTALLGTFDPGWADACGAALLD